MAKFDDLTITNNGLDMIALSQSGAKLIFTKIKLGDGQIGDNDVMKLTDIINERMTSQISSIEAKGEGQVAIKFTVDNSELTSGFFVREIGIFAKINDGGEEKLYAYTNAGNYTNYLADNKTPVDAIITKIDLAVGNATDINFTVDKSIVYVSLEDLDTAIKNHDSSPTTHTEAFEKHNADENAHDNLIKKLFGSAEATLDSIKLKIKDWAKEVCLPLSGGTMKGNINANGYNITATKFIGNLQGNADSATKATQDKNGFQIDTGYLKRNQTTQNDMNACTVEGIYRFSGDLTGAWTGTSWGTLLVFNNKYNGGSGVDSTYLVQMALPTDGRIWTRQRVNAGGWSSWVKIANTNDCTDTLKKVYPVGSIYMSTVSTNPATLFGFGTWEAMPAGRVLLAQGTASWGTYNAGSTGGEATHKLTVGELPSHNHAMTYTPIQGALSGCITGTKIGDKTGSVGVFEWGNYYGLGLSLGDVDFITAEPHINAGHTHTLIATGSNQAHNNIQPYIAVYIWKRVN